MSDTFEVWRSSQKLHPTHQKETKILGHIHHALTGKKGDYQNAKETAEEANHLDPDDE